MVGTELSVNVQSWNLVARGGITINIKKGGGLKFLNLLFKEGCFLFGLRQPFPGHLHVWLVL